MKHIILIILTTMVNVSLALAQTDLTESITDTYNEKADSLEYCLIENFLNKEKGIFWTTPQDVDHSSQFCYWQQAHAIDVIIYAYQRALKDGNTEKAEEYKQYMELWFTNHAGNYNGNTWVNPYTDDMAWIGLAIYHMAEALGGTKYYRNAKSICDNIANRQVTDATGTWLPWNTHDSFTTGYACTMAPSCLLAAKIYLYNGDEKYLNNAIAYYNYMNDHVVHTDGSVEDPPLTYTQGTFAEACRVLYHITGSSSYKTKAGNYLNYAFTSSRCTHNGLLRHEGTSMDQSIFKAVLIPYATNYIIDEDMQLTRRRSLLNLLQKNAQALWGHLDFDRYPQMYCPYYWGEDFDYSQTASMGAMVSGASLMENTTRACETIIQQKEEADGIENVITNDYHNDKIYNIQGVEVDSSYKGIIIRNGKKYINR